MYGDANAGLLHQPLLLSVTCHVGASVVEKAISVFIALTLGASPNDLGAAHRTSADLIESAHVVFHLKRRFERPEPNSGAMKLVEVETGGEYWCKPGLVRGRENLGEDRYEWLHRDGIEYTSAKIKGADTLPSYAAGSRRADRSAHYLDLWSYALFSLDNLRIDQYFEKHRDSLSISTDVLNGIRCVVVTADLKSRNYKMQFWMDPSVNHLLRAMRMIMHDGSRMEAEVTDFREHQPGVFFPERIVRRYRPASSRTRERPWDEECVLVAEINRPIPDQVFQIKYHPGVHFVDQMNGTIYPVDTDGRRIGPAKPIAGDSPDAPPAALPTSVGTEESTGASWWKYTLALSVTGIIVSLILVVHSRIRK